MTDLIGRFRVLTGTDKRIPGRAHEMIILAATSLIYFSNGDENAFFSWLKAIPAIERFEGAGRDLNISVRELISDDDLRNIIALFKRYNIDMRQLAVFKNESNQMWVFDRRKFWFYDVFGN